MAESQIKKPAFTSQGYFKDEVILEFEDEKMLYVSQALLTLSSPVFEAMFNDEFREKQENKVKLVGKTYDDTLEFLLCLYPRSKNHIDETNVLRVAPIAEEYQILSLITACQEFMKTWLKRQEMQTEKDKTNWHKVLQNAKISVDIICTATKIGYVDVCEYAAGVIAKYPFGIYTALEGDKIMTNNYYNRRIITECRERFFSLPADWKYAITLKRLSFIENNEFQS